VGLTSQSDVESATAQVGSLQAQLPQFDAQIAQAMNGLAVFDRERAGGSGCRSWRWRERCRRCRPSVPIGLPSTLARRRPDIRRAESDLHAATAEIGVAVAQITRMYPLTGSVGDACATGEISCALVEFCSGRVGPSISLPIFEGGALRANVRIAKAQAGRRRCSIARRC